MDDVTKAALRLIRALIKSGKNNTRHCAVCSDWANHRMPLSHWPECPIPALMKAVRDRR